MVVKHATPAQRPLAGAGDPQWYRDATIYQLHVKSFCDSNGDGIGDFKGLIQKLDYIAELGVDTLWLLPFYPSPRRDDGYDISNYRDIHPDYGTMADFKKFMTEAHARGLRVITELVINHTSDQHPWFKRARAAKPGSAARNFYVWSDTDQAYAGTRVIFLDTEKSNWSWDAEAGAYFWHRFYSHQPDLNFDNPRVLAEVLSIMRFWLDLGVDGLRLDAVPYLVEREGTNNENLPETHRILKQIRAAIDAYGGDRMLLAEANQWPEDAQQYFGDGDECHMSFHFPLMPRMYMAIAQEDRFPITDIMRQTPDIPATCQWVVFLRNHDELTLEMVTDSERDYLWKTYASDRRARLNLGIRRRLSPLLERDRRRIELMTGLLLSMPGTPVIYYGDEIGMGDNIHLGDRDGVRTPMQWSPDRNGGFSRAAPEVLVLPPIMDANYGFTTVNVEAQETDPYSLLHWTRRMLAVRGKQKAFGRGTQIFITPGNRKILAFLREFDGQTILCISNLSRTAQAVEVDLTAYAGRTPIDLIGGSVFPPIGKLAYLFTFPAFAFYWFILADEGELPSWHTPLPAPLPEFSTFVLRHGLGDILERSALARLEADVLPAYLRLRRWFAAKDLTIRRVSLIRPLLAAKDTLILAELDVETDRGQETYLLPLAIAWDDEPQSALSEQLALARVRRTRRMGLLTDAFTLDALPLAIMQRLRDSANLKITGGEIRFAPTSRLKDVVIVSDAPIRRLSAEQSNSSLIIGNAVMLKVLRRVTAGTHPEVEMSEHLTACGYANAPPLLGAVWRALDDGQTAALIIVQGFVANQGDGWTWGQNLLARAADAIALTDSDNEAELDAFAGYSDFMGVIGTRLAELHAVLAQPSDNPDFTPIVMSDVDAITLAKDVNAQLGQACEAISRIVEWPTAAAADDAAFLLSHVAALEKVVAALSRQGMDALMTRVHGDFHLGQVLVAQGDAYIIDFEGEPARPLAERREKSNPLRDVAGMIRSLDYARAMANSGRTSLAVAASARRTLLLERVTQEAIAAFLTGYRAVHERAETRWVSQEAEQSLLDLFLMQKAAYEIRYEAANRVTWISVPLHGLVALARRLIADTAEKARA